ncbi:MAG: DUF4974 domain-containing protein [Bacteroidales bacterium]|nr:DUF4974 domain-containing protein [Bacteroidales bacterium]
MNTFENKSLEMWEASAAGEMDPVVKERILGGLCDRIKKERKKRRIRVAVSCSAALAGVAGCIAAALLLLPSQSIPETATEVPVFRVAALKGQQSSVTLPDGTTVQLNSDSFIICKSDFNISNRDIYLEGEAYFNVARNEELPFTVNACDQIKVSALGTSFDVKAYPDDKFITATLESGSILVESSDDSTRLTPGQYVSWSKEGGSLEKDLVRTPCQLIPWIKNELYFDNASLEDIGRTLSRMYDITVVFKDSKVRQYSYTGLIRNNSLTNVLQMISATSAVRCRIADNKLEFSSR